jgi:RNA polymerase sigma-70 factor (ECF subfamily)
MVPRLEKTVVPVDERRMVERARAGEREAFDELVRRHYGRVYGLAFRLAGNPEDAEDLAQECFVRAHESLRWYRGEASFSTWLFRVVVHLARDRFRAKSRRPDRAPEGIAPAEDLAGKELEPAEALRGKELVSALDRALARLPERLRTALVLRALEGLEYEEIGAVCGVTPATARTQVMRARRELARRLRPWLAPESRSEAREDER